MAAGGAVVPAYFPGCGQDKTGVLRRVLEIARENFKWYTLAKDFLSSNDPLKEFHHPNLAPIVLPGMENLPQAGQMELF